jgi:beta-barrel assembly-enhancing protease
LSKRINSVSNKFHWRGIVKKIQTLTVRAGVMALVASILISPITFAQTRIQPPKNPYSLDKDVQLGRQAANEVEQKLPVINDGQVQRYIERVGRRLVESIPPEFQHDEFQYSFRVVNANDINAFALPGGFTYVNRGLIEVANNEGELAGVMAHEISHVALRHGTAQAAKAQKYAIGATAGQILGAIIGGGLGGVVAQGSQLGVGAYYLKFSREYEKQADILGAQMMANAGYDPHDLANMFRTIEKQSAGRGGPEWLSSHPNPGNRYEAINREADLLRVRRPARESNEFARIRALLGEMPRARSMNDISRGDQRHPQDGRNVGNRVESPSPRYRSYSAGNLFQLGVPENWRELRGNDTITFAPEGAYGEVQGQFIFTHGVMAGITRTQGRDLRRATDQFLNSLAQGNPNLRRQAAYQRSSISGHEGLATTLSNVSDVTGRPEIISVFTTMLNNGDLFYIIPVAPQDEYRNYQRVFQNIVRSIQIND